MFGGLGVYAEGLFFAIVDDDVLYFKVDDGNRPAFERHGMKAFQPFPDRPATMQYYEVPAAVLENREALHGWARAALGVARAAQAKRQRATTRRAAPRRPKEG
jgi:DNA transformation protein